MTRRPSWIIALGAFVAAVGVGAFLAQFDLSALAVLGLGLAATAILGAVALGLEFLRQSRPPRPTPGERRLRV